MKLLKPNWVTHDGHPIFSVDIHPDGSRFATGGQGADTGQIVIWSMAPVMNEDDELNEGVPKLLCQMDNHLACVNCVRWSGDGRYLASGGDDKVIMIWQIGRYGNSTVFGGSGKIANVEHWKCVSTLRGHSGDVLDLAWSPHDAWLASCSVDNTVVIWNTKRWQEILAVLKGHTGLVKGVSWDPVGKYIASQSDDKTLRIWRTHDWQQECIISEPFLECGGTTHILRLSWSPDGQYLVSAHAMNNSGPTAQIIERDGWKTNKDFVGHRKAITCVRFNPNILSKPGKDGGKVQNFCCCAIGSRDRSLSVWLTYLKRPLVVVHDLFSNSVLDISWSHSGSQLLVCSWDGTVAYVDFTEEEIGKSISTEEKNKWHHRLYGKSLTIQNSITASANLIEDAEILKIQEDQRRKEQQVELTPSNSNCSIKTNNTNSRPPMQIKGPTDKQIETRMPDGRRRITPLFIPPDPEIGDIPVPFNHQALPSFSSSTESKSKIVIEKGDEIHSVSSSDASNAPKGVEKSPADVPKEAVVSNAGQDVQMHSALAGTVEPQCDKVPSVQTTPASVPVAAGPVKRKAELTTLSGRPPEKKRPGRPPLLQSAQQTLPPPQSEKELGVSPSLLMTAPLTEIVFPPLKLSKLATLKFGGAKAETMMSVELETDIPLASGKVVSKVKCSTGTTVHWEHLLSGRGAALSGNKKFICIACEDCTLNVLSFSSGCKLYPAIVLSSPAAQLTCKYHHVMVITSFGYVSVWDLEKGQCCVKSESVTPLLKGSGDGCIKNCSVTDEGLPVLTLSSGKSFVYSKNLSSWVQVGNTEDVVAQCSDHYSSMPSHSTLNGSLLPLASLQSSLHRSSRTAKSLSHAGHSLQQAGTLSFLDDQLNSSLLLNSSREYKFWLLTLVRYLSTEGLENRLKDICGSLLGPITSKTNTWQPYILGLNKRDLLKEILPIIASNLRLQRLYTEFQDELQMLNECCADL